APYARWREWHQRRIVRASDLVFVVDEGLRRRYGPRSVALPESALRERDVFVAPDRMCADAVRFLVSGRIDAHKGVDDALRAFARVRRDELRSELHVVGDGPARGEMESLAASLGLGDAVTFHGWLAATDDLFGLYRRM